MKRACLLMAIIIVAGMAVASVETFDANPVLSETQASDTWYTDRYAPAGFVSEYFDGDNRLKVSISANDAASSRPSGYSDVFYNTQGRKFDLSGITEMSIDLYIASDWATTGRRMAGLWGTGFNSNGGVSLYPIVEFTSDGSNPRFRAWPVDPSTSGWTDLGLPTGFAYDQWYTLSIKLGNGITMSVGDLSHTNSNVNGTVEFGNVILQGYNTTEGVDYDIYWDNFTAVPEPATLALLGLGALVLRKRK